MGAWWGWCCLRTSPDGHEQGGRHTVWAQLGGKAQEPSAPFFDPRLFAGSQESLVAEYPTWTAAGTPGRPSTGESPPGLRRCSLHCGPDPRPGSTPHTPSYLIISTCLQSICLSKERKRKTQKTHGFCTAGLGGMPETSAGGSEALVGWGPIDPSQVLAQPLSRRDPAQGA